MLVSFPLEARRLLLCPERQEPLSQNLRFCQLPFQGRREQNALMCQRSERSHNHRQSLFELIFILLFLLTFSVNLNWCLSVIIPFLLSASRTHFPALLYLKQLFSSVTATFFFHIATSRLSRFAVTILYQLRGRQSIAAL